MLNCDNSQNSTRQFAYIIYLAVHTWTSQSVPVPGSVSLIVPDPGPGSDYLILHCISVPGSAYLYLTAHICTLQCISVPGSAYLYLAVHTCTLQYVPVPSSVSLIVPDPGPGSDYLYLAVHICTWQRISVPGSAYLYFARHTLHFIPVPDSEYL